MNTQSTYVDEIREKALHEEPKEDVPKGLMSPKGDILHPSSLPKVLRYIGATTLGLSALSFAVHRVKDLDSLERYYSFLGFTGLLAAAGMFCALFLKEDKGARTFMGISLAFMPALFLQLGALVYFITRGIPSDISEFFTLTAPNDQSVIIALAVSIPIMMAIAFGSFASLARSKALSLSGIFILLCTVLLIPVRTSDLTALLLVGEMAAGSMILSRRFRGDRVFKTFEGKVALSALALPVLLLIGRSVLLYKISIFFWGAMFGIIGLLSWNIEEEGRSDSAYPSRIFSIMNYMLAWCCFVLSAAHDSGSLVFMPALSSHYDELYLMLLTLPIALGLWLAASSLGKSSDSARRVAGMTACYPMAYQMLTVGGSGYTLASLFIGTAVISAAYLRRDRSLLKSGAAVVMCVIAANIHYALDLYRMSPWLTLGIAGGIIVLASSYIERNLGKLIARIEATKETYKSWN